MRIYWHKFITHHGKLFKAVDRLLHRSGFRLKLEFDTAGTCTDAYIEDHQPPGTAQRKE